MLVFGLLLMSDAKTRHRVILNEVHATQVFGRTGLEVNSTVGDRAVCSLERSISSEDEVLGTFSRPSPAIVVVDHLLTFATTFMKRHAPVYSRVFSRRNGGRMEASLENCLICGG